MVSRTTVFRLLLVLPQKYLTTRGCRSTLSHDNIRSGLWVCVEGRGGGGGGVATSLAPPIACQTALRARPPFTPCSYGNSSVATSTSLFCPHPHTSQRCWVCVTVTDKWDAARWRLRGSWLVLFCTSALVSYFSFFTTLLRNRLCT